MEPELSLEVYPNPARDMVSIDYMLDETLSEASLTVYDHMGKMVSEKKIYQADGFAQESLDISSWTNGVYFVKIQSPNQKGVVKKLIKQ